MKKILQKICSMMILLLSIVTTSCSTLPKVTLIEDVETYTMDKEETPLLYAAKMNPISSFKTLEIISNTTVIE